MDRRSFLKKAGVTGSALLGAKLLPGALGRGARAMAQGANEPPNILFLMVDQMRFPQWFPQPAALAKVLPSLARLEAGSVTFREHYTAANACTPSRGCLLTGLYAHQTGCLVTNAQSQPALDPGFPTWGTQLRGLGYETYWYGKWHLSQSCDLEPFGFSGGTCPSPNGGPGQGLTADPRIVDQFLAWLEAQGDRGPWCTTVSLVNPHDIAFYYRFTDHVPGESDPPHVFTELPGNFERPADLMERQKPRLQRALQETSAVGTGVLPFRGPDFETGWLKMLDLYLQLQRYVDAQIGRVLQALEANPALARRTIIVFTADHGEYAGSHGLRGKGGAVYDEAIHVPLYVKDPTGRFARRTDVERRQLTSSVDITPLLLTLATGDNMWRTLPQYAHLAQRLDIAAILRAPTAPGRPYVLHTTDEDFVEELAINPFQREIPSHVIGYRTATPKLATHSFWAPGSIEIRGSGQEAECYDYSTPDGQMELTNLAPEKPPLYNRLYDALVNDAIPNELRQPLPSNLQAAQQAGINAYLAYEQQSTSEG